MRRLSYSLYIFILFIACISLTGCRPTPQYPASLLMADSLTQSSPDSAILLLAELEPQMQQAPESILRYYQLLTIKAKDKAFITHTSDSLILSLLQYYTDKGDVRLLPEACYYAGRVTRDLGDAPQALDYFHQALDAMERPAYQKAEREHASLQLRSKIYAQMGYLFKRQHLYDEAIKCFEQGYQVDSINRDTVGMMLCKSDCGDVLRQKGDISNSFLRYNEAMKFAVESQDTTHLFGLALQQALLYCIIGDFQQAKDCIEPYPSELKRNTSRIDGVLARIYSGLKDSNTASLYFKNLLLSKDISARSNANLWLANWSNNNGFIKEAIEYLDAYIQIEDTINALKNDEVIVLSQSLYNYQQREKEINELKIQRTSMYAQLWMFAVIIVLLFLLLYLEHIRRHKVKQRYEHLRRILSANKLYVEQKQELMVTAISDMKNSDTYAVFANKSKNRETLTSEEWMEVERLLDKFMPEFIPKLRGVQSFNDTEWKLSLLLKMDFTLPQIASMIGLTYMAVHASQARLFKKVFKGNVTYQNWTDFISSL